MYINKLFFFIALATIITFGACSSTKNVSNTDLSSSGAANTSGILNTNIYDQLKSEVGLKKSQIKKIKAIEQDFTTQSQVLRAGYADGTRKINKDEIFLLTEKKTESIKAVMTPDQHKKYISLKMDNLTAKNKTSQALNNHRLAKKKEKKATTKSTAQENQKSDTKPSTASVSNEPQEINILDSLNLSQKQLLQWKILHDKRDREKIKADKKIVDTNATTEVTADQETIESYKVQVYMRQVRAILDESQFKKFTSLKAIVNSKLSTEMLKADEEKDIKKK